MTTRPRSSSQSGPSCAFPSWPLGDSLKSHHDAIPSAFLSDDDLLFDDLGDADARDYMVLMQEVVALKRPGPPADVVLETLVESVKPMMRKWRKSGAKKSRRLSKPLSPVVEVPENGASGS